MWLQLAARDFPVFRMGGTFHPIIAPYHGMETKPDFIQCYEDSEWRSIDVTLLEYLRKSNKVGRIICYIVDAYRRENNLTKKDKIDDEVLASFAQEFETSGEKVIAADMMWRMNDKYYGQWLALNMPFKKWADLRDEEVALKVPDRYYHMAVALRRRPDYWRQEGHEQVMADMKLEAVNTTQIETIVAMIKARTHLIDLFLNGSLHKDELVHEPHPSGVHNSLSPLPLVYDGKQDFNNMRLLVA